MRSIAILLVLMSCVPVRAQWCVWAEEFENGCATGCLASAFVGPNGAWAVTLPTANGACPNRWFISCAENGNAVGTCGTGCGNNETLHVGNSQPATCISPNGCAFCPTGDCGAAYDAGCPPGLCGFCTLICPGPCNSALTDQRAESPVINLTAYTNLTLSFKYMENGQGTMDNATLWYFDGAIWTQLVDLPKTAGSCAGGQGLWTSYSIALPASANNNPGVRIGFRWVNNNDATGADPSIAVDDIQLTAPYVPVCNGPIVNELSNGPSGGKEYIELLVCGPSCSTIDLRNFKIDDNNGILWNGFGTTMVSSGLSAGHLRFSNAGQWAAVPAGSLILIYNNADLNALLPADDPSDTAPVDSVYVLPANHALLQGCNTAPNATTTSGYNCAFGGGNWNTMALRDQGDAGQTRDPTGRYYHGISYGSNANNMNNGGLDLLRISMVDHGGRVLFFNTGNFRLSANFTSALVAGNETPGAPNNAANAAYITVLQCLTQPIELLSFTASAMDGRVRMEWITATETDNDFFTLERSTDAITFSPIGTVDGAGISLHERRYVFDDIEPLEGLAYYRLRQTDFDGSSSLGRSLSVEYRSSPVVSIHVEANAVVISGADGPGTWSLFDPLGRPIAGGALAIHGATHLVLPDASATLMILHIEAEGSLNSFRILHVDGTYLVLEGK